jgi:hypothetical protein
MANEGWKFLAIQTRRKCGFFLGWLYNTIMTINLVFSSHEPYQNFLDSAEAAHAQSQYKEAVILVQTALELFTEKTLGHLYKVRDIEYLKPQFEHLLINYNIANGKVSGLYMALAEDKITQEPFWSGVVAHVELRNDLVHEGKDASVAQSRASLDAVAAVVAHIKAHNSI